jgi:amino acid adenylation domain-containing protein
VYITNLTDLLDQAAKRFPEKIAFADQERQMTFAQVRSRARRAAAWIAGRINETRRPVAVVIERSVNDIVAFMAVLYAGCFYVPVNPGLPQQRRQQMFAAISPALTITEAILEEIFQSAADCGQPESAADCGLLEDIRGRHRDNAPVYAMFTSGSTGTPKAVLISHRAVINLVNAFGAVFPLNEACVFANQAPFDFDVSTKDIYLTLANSATMHIVPRPLFSEPAKLLRFLNERSVNTLIWSTSALRMLTAFHFFDNGTVENLRLVMFSGETMPCKTLNYWRGPHPAALFVNLYGPTEITCNCSYYIVDGDFEDDEALPIGKAFPNTEILLLNKTGEQGEIAVMGTCLALGYYGDAALTAAKFIQNPHNDSYEEKLYLTGDIGSYNAKGQLMFHGRRDDQIKHMGHRVELSEIELAANALPFIDFSCCIYDEAAEELVLFYQSGEPQKREIAVALREKLPNYMLPRRFLWQKQLPLNKNGKIDRPLLAGQWKEEKRK